MREDAESVVRYHIGSRSIVDLVRLQLADGGGCRGRGLGRRELHE